MDASGNNLIDLQTLQLLHALRSTARAAADWKAAFDGLLAWMRAQFMYDNLALYKLDARTRVLDIRHARAVGRGRRAEADVSWGEGIAAKVIAGKATVVEEPVGPPSGDRLAKSHLIGLPIFVAGRLDGALVFVRFGGPAYSEAHRLLAEWIADTLGSLLESRGLHDARSQLQSARRQMRMQEDFVSSISHEIRTPLGFIKGYASSLLRQDARWDKATEREFLSIIEDEADRLTRLMENMLESARFRSKTAQFKFQPVQIDGLIRDVATRLRAHHPDLQIRLNFERMPAVMGDGVRLSQIFENLFGNALKYAPGSPITIGMICDRKKLRIAFADQGPGIPEEYLPFVFRRFYRVPADATSTGTGLGLYICQQIVHAHHGKIWVESELDRGTTFLIELPLPTSV